MMKSELGSDAPSPHRHIVKDERPTRDARGQVLEFHEQTFSHPRQSPQQSQAGMAPELPLPVMPHLAGHPAFRRMVKPQQIVKDVTPEGVGDTSPLDRRFTAMEKAQAAEIERLNAEMLEMKRHLGLAPPAPVEKPAPAASEPAAPVVFNPQQQMDRQLAEAYASARQAQARYGEVQYRYPSYGDRK